MTTVACLCVGDEKSGELKNRTIRMVQFVCLICSSAARVMNGEKRRFLENNKVKRRTEHLTKLSTPHLSLNLLLRLKMRRAWGRHMFSPQHCLLAHKFGFPGIGGLMTINRAKYKQPFDPDTRQPKV